MGNPRAGLLCATMACELWPHHAMPDTGSDICPAVCQAMLHARQYFAVTGAHALVLDAPGAAGASLGQAFIHLEPPVTNPPEPSARRQTITSAATQRLN